MAPDVSQHRNLGLLPSNCGPIEDNKIVGGNRTRLFEMPWMVLLSYNSGKNYLSEVKIKELYKNLHQLLAVSHLNIFLSVMSDKTIKEKRKNKEVKPTCR